MSLLDIRFVILTESRSGSNLLVSLLDSHPNISCHSEVFHRKRVYAKPPLNSLTVEHRNTHIQQVLDAIFTTQDSSREILARGFKLFYYHKPSLIVKLARDPAIRFVILRRSDKLAQYASRKIALRTGKWKKLEKRRGPVELKVESQAGENRQERVQYRFSGHLAYCVFSELCHFLAMRVLRHFRSPSIELRYEDLVTDMDGQMRGALAFLDLPQKELKTKLRRQNILNVTDRFSNPRQAGRGLVLERKVVGFFARLGKLLDALSN